MGNMLIYHPETQGSVVVPEESMVHYRAAGWLTQPEWDELQERDAHKLARAEAEKAAAAARSPVAGGKSASGEAKKE